MSAALTVLTLACAALTCAAVTMRLSPSASTRAAGLVLGLVAWGGLLLAIVPEGLHDHWWVLVVAGDVLLLAAWTLGAELVGRERWLLLAGAVTMTIRVPVPIGGDTAMLLAPFYIVVGLGAAVLLRNEIAQLAMTGAAPVSRARSERAVDAGARSSVARTTRFVDVMVGAIPVVGALSLIWSIDRTESAEVLALFLIPFALAYALVRAWVTDRETARIPALGMVAVAAIAALVGILQAAAQTVWWNPKVIDANRFRPDIRVNSIYWDPNIYGRVLVVALLAIVATMLVMRMTRRRWVCSLLVVGLLLAALWHTFSQSSWLALAAATMTFAILTLPPMLRRWVGGAVLLVVLAGLPLAASMLGGADMRTRLDVVRTGVELARDRPVLGSGLGTFELATQRLEAKDGARDDVLDASHTTPITVAAELGVLGLSLYVLLLVSAAAAVLARWKRTVDPTDTTTVGRWPSAPIIWATGALVAIITHSLLYAGFFEDPVMWIALAVLAGLSTQETGATAAAAGSGSRA